MNAAGSSEAREAFRLANDLHLDLIVATGLYPKFASLDEELLRSGGQRLCLLTIVVTLSKWREFYERFNRVLPASVRGLAKQLMKDYDTPEVRAIRNSLAHSKGPLLSSAQLEGAVWKMARGDLRDFMERINDLDERRSDTAVRRIEAIRDALRVENQFADSDLTP